MAVPGSARLGVGKASCRNPCPHPCRFRFQVRSHLQVGAGHPGANATSLQNITMIMNSAAYQISPFATSINCVQRPQFPFPPPCGSRWCYVPGGRRFRGGQRGSGGSGGCGWDIHVSRPKAERIMVQSAGGRGKERHAWAGTRHLLVLILCNYYIM